MKNNKYLPILNLIGFVIMIVMNTLAVILPLNGKSTKQLSDALPNLFVPAGFTFSIWSIIYLGLFVFVIAQFKGFSGKKERPKFLEQIGLYFFISCIINASWIVAWHFQFIEVSLILMIAFLYCLIKIYKKLYIGLPTKLSTKLSVHVPFSIYLGWISIATIANVTAVMVSYDLYAFGNLDVLLTLLVMLVGFVLATLMLNRHSDYAYALVVIWAYFGIYSKRIASNPVINPIIWVAIGVMIFLTLSILYTWNRNRKTTSKLS